MVKMLGRHCYLLPVSIILFLSSHETQGSPTNITVSATANAKVTQNIQARPKEYYTPSNMTNEPVLIFTPRTPITTIKPITTTFRGTATTPRAYFEPRAGSDSRRKEVAQVDPPTFLETVETLLEFLIGGHSIFDNIGLIVSRLSDFAFRAFDHFRYKFTWFSNEIDYLQCISNSLLRSNFFGRHMSIFLKIFNEALSFIRNVFGDGVNEGEALNNVSDTILDDRDAKANRNLIRRIASRESATLMGVNKFTKCSSNYLTSVFTRVLNVLYAPTIDESTVKK